MNRKRWDRLLGHLKEALVHRSRDPGVWLETDWEGKEVRIRSDAPDRGEWVVFDMDTDSGDQTPRQLAVRMVEGALGPK